MIVNKATQEVIGRTRYELTPGETFMSGEVRVLRDDTGRIIKLYKFPGFAKAAEWYAKIVAAAKKGA